MDESRLGRVFVQYGIEKIRTAPRSPWQNAYAERVIGSIRRECLDHIIVLNETGLRLDSSQVAMSAEGASCAMPWRQREVPFSRNAKDGIQLDSEPATLPLTA